MYLLLKHPPGSLPVLSSVWSPPHCVEPGLGDTRSTLLSTLPFMSQPAPLPTLTSRRNYL